MTTAHTLTRHPLLAVTGDPRGSSGTVQHRRPAGHPSRDGGLRAAVEVSGLSVVRALPGLAVVAVVVLKATGAA